MFKRRAKLLGKILLGGFLALVAFLLIERWRGQIALANYKKELRAKGEKLSPQDFVPLGSTEENRAPQIIAAIERLKPGSLLPGSLPPQMRVLSSGRAIVGFREPRWIENGSYRSGEWVEGKITNRWDQVAADVEANAPILNEICTAMEGAVFNHNLDYAGGPKMRLPHLTKAKSLAQWLQGEIALALHEGRRSDALAALNCQIQTPKLMAEDKVLIGELVRCALGAIARVNTWEALQLDGWKDEELSVLQNAWTDQQFAKAMATSMERELMSMILTYELLRRSNDEAYQMFEMLSLFGSMFESIATDDESEAESESLWEKIPFHEEITEFWRRQIYCRIWRFAWSHQAEHKALRQAYRALTLTREAAAEKSYLGIHAQFEALEAADVPVFFDRVRFLFVGLTATYSKSALRPMRAETDRAVCVTAIALKRYSLRHGKYPDNLDSLVPEFLDAIPIDYMDGKPIKYRLNENKRFTLYSVGTNETDDGGDFSLPPDVKSTRDLWRRPDYIWPEPATPEEVEAYRRETSQD